MRVRLERVVGPDMVRRDREGELVDIETKRPFV